MPHSKHEASCTDVRQRPMNTAQLLNCKCCGKQYKSNTWLEKHSQFCKDTSPAAVQGQPVPVITTQRDMVGRCKNLKQQHPERLKVLIWKAFRVKQPLKETIKNIRETFDIEKNVQIFKRGTRQNKRIELRFSTRQSTLLHYERMRKICKEKKLSMFCTLGSKYSEREKRKVTDHSTPNGMPITPSPSQSTVVDEDDSDSHHDISTIKVLQWNAQSISNKMDELRLLLSEQNIDIGCISETRIKESDKWTDKIKGYSLINASRPNREGGGVCLLVRNNLGVSNVSTFYSEHMEHITATITVNKKFSFSITSAYARNGCKNMTTELNQCAMQKHSFIAGDFNSKHSLWGSTKTDPSGIKLFEWVDENNLIVLNNNSHTYQSHSTGRTDSIDVSIASPNLASKITDWKILDDTLGSDHFPSVSCIEYACLKNTTHNSPKWNLKKANRDLFSTLIQTSSIQAKKDIEKCDSGTDDMVNILTECIIKAAEESYPKAKTCKRPPTPWWNEEIDELRKAKRKARRKWKKSHTLENKISLKKHQAKLRRAINSARKSSWQQFVNSMTRDTQPSVVWKKIKAINGSSHTSQSALMHDGNVVTDPQDQAEIFGSYYSSKSNVMDTQKDPKLFTETENYIHDNIDMICESHDDMDTPFTMEELNMSLSELKNSATGEDRVHNQMLKDLPENGKIMLLTTINEIWQEGNYPSQWKISKIIPLLKPNKNRQEVKSYRPVALTSCIGKLVERMINRRLVWKIQQEDIFYHSQCGFRPKSGTVDALLKITEYCHESLHNKTYTVIVLIDLEGAFDKVWWQGLIAKAASIGISGNTLKLLKSFLKERSIKVQVDKTTSQEFHINAGTPQGAVLSPTIFNIMMYDLPSIISDPCIQVTYADDGTIMLSHKNLNYIVEKLNHCLAAINEWTSKWKLKLSKEKTEYTVVTNKRKHVKPLNDLGLNINGEKIKYNSNPKVLGLILDQRLTWKNHIDSVADQCTRRLNLMKIISSKQWGADLSTLRLFYLAFIRSKIMYASEIWSSCSKSNLQKLCRLQNKALRLVTGALKTTPTSALEIEADVPPLDLYIEDTVLKKRIKMHFMPATSPGSLSKANYPSSFYQRSKVLLKSRSISLPKKQDQRMSEQKIVNDTPPWSWESADIHLSLPGITTKGESNPSLLKQISLEVINEEYKGYTTIYTDGSLDRSDEKAGAGVFIREEKREIIIPLPPSSILEAELVAIDRALQEIRELPKAQTAEGKFVILSDSMSSLQSLLSYKPTDYYRLCQSIYETIKSIPAKVVLQWIPSHVDLFGNDKADELAKIASQSGPVNRSSPSISDNMCKVHQSMRNNWCNRWNTGEQGRRYHSIQNIPNKVRYVGWNRKEQVQLSRVRLHHFPCQSYLLRFGLSDTNMCKLCDTGEETVHHMLFECAELANLRSYDGDQPMKEVMENKNGEWASIISILDERKRRTMPGPLTSDA